MPEPAAKRASKIRFCGKTCHPRQTRPLAGLAAVFPTSRAEAFASAPPQNGGRYVGHFAIIDNVMYNTNPPMPPWVNALYFLSLADIQEVGCSPEQLDSA